MTKTYTLHAGNSREVLATFPDNSVDSIVTDPPYGLGRIPDINVVLKAWMAGETYTQTGGGFMGKEWDSFIPGPEIWRECFRVLKPGGYILAFAGTRTQDVMALALRMAGFEIRDMIAWVYGCLSEDTLMITPDGARHYKEASAGDLVLCYDPKSGAYSYQPILEVVEYDYSDTAYRLVGDFGEQIVSRNHRVLVELDGRETFQLAETLEREARIPVLEGLSDLRKVLHCDDKRASGEEQNVRTGMHGGDDITCSTREDPDGAEKGEDDILRGVRGTCLEAGRLASEGVGPDLQSVMQREASLEEAYPSFPQREIWLDEGVRGCSREKNDGGRESELEGWRDLSEQEGGVFKPADKIR